MIITIITIIILVHAVMSFDNLMKDKPLITRFSERRPKLNISN